MLFFSVFLCQFLRLVLSIEQIFLFENTVNSPLQNISQFNGIWIVQRRREFFCFPVCDIVVFLKKDVVVDPQALQNIRNEMEWTSSAIKNSVGVDVKFFRPPYISVNNTMYQNIDYPFIQGTLINDWENSTSVQQRINNALGAAKDGQIILLHDFQGNSQTVQALPQIIEGLQKQGYTFVTVSELFEKKGVNPNVEYKLWSSTY